MNIVDSVPSRHGAGILQILNDAIVTSTALYEYQPRTMESMVPWFADKAKRDCPVVVAVDDKDAVLGFATYGPFRAFPAYKYTIEHSVYVDRGHRGKGIGMALLRHLVMRATAQQYHVMVGVVDAGNVASVALHERAGFQRAGVLREVGYKFSGWLDAAFYQLVLPPPLHPVDG
jgi:phosphinothricin acetyltransferase